MHPVAVLQVLVLITLANGAPVAAKKLLGAHGRWPLDCGIVLPDGQPLLGASKTVRGVVLSLLLTAAAAPLVGVPWRVGALIAAGAMAGDLASSFLKRRLRLRPSSRALGIDQIPEALLPALAAMGPLGLGVADAALVVALFFVGEIVASRLLYRVHLRDEPY